MYRFYLCYVIVMLIPLLALLSGCECGPYCQLMEKAMEGNGGGQDVVTIDLPFDTHTTTLCTQGAHGDYSHTYRTTKYDVDLDTPNDRDELVFAPVGGVAYVHDDSRTRNFGVHINIDMGDGTYIILAHLDDTFIESGSEVAAGQIIGTEGATGIAVGDHVHIGRHQGDASKDGIYGSSVEGLAFSMRDFDQGNRSVELTTEEMICGIPGGHDYVSDLETSRWHPDGSLVKVPGSTTVYLLGSWTARPFMNEEAFLSRKYSFEDVALISPNELACYGLGEGIDGAASIRPVYDAVAGVTWMLFVDGDGNRFRQAVGRTGWHSVLESWGVNATETAELEQVTSSDVLSYAYVSGLLNYRDGTLVKRDSASDVFVMSNGIARPIESWNDLLLLGWGSRDILEVPESEFDAVVTFVGSCAIDSYCVSREDVLSCGGLGESSEALITPADDLEVAFDDSGVLIIPDTGDLPRGQLLTVRWTAPSGAIPSRIALSGEYTHADGSSTGWQTWAEQGVSSSLTYTWLDANPGDRFRFSIEYVQSGVTSWSCLAPYPPGTTQGTTAADFNGEVIAVFAVADPMSSGCGLQVDVP